MKFFNRYFATILLSVLTISSFTAQNSLMKIHVAGACGMCQDRIEEASTGVSGVRTASWNVRTQKLSLEVNTDQFDEAILHQKLADAGHDTDRLKAPVEIYNELPFCCQYRNPDNPHKKDSQGQEQNTDIALKGRVNQLSEQGIQEPLIGANLMWLETKTGGSTGTDGSFKIEKTRLDEWLVVSYIGFRSDTLLIDTEEGEFLEIVLIPDNYLETIEIRHRKKTTEISAIEPIKTLKITEKELHKAACCNLSESFETNPSVDVSFTDAVTGARVIEMLGLAGKYVQITRELIPEIRGLASVQGLTYTPGPWIDGIQMNMGTGSVVNGFESMTGQINVELRKPENSDLLYLNLFGSKDGRMEANLNLSKDLNDFASTGLLLHGNLLNMRSDHNKDGFVDVPTGTQFIALNRWKLYLTDDWEAQLGVKATYLDKQSGQMGFERNENKNNYWGAILKTNRIEGWLKTGTVFSEHPFSSIGFQLAGVNHDQRNLFGLRNYDGNQKSLYANMIYQGILGSENHGFKTGVSFLWDIFKESVGGDDYERNEKIPGAFFEYTYLYTDKLTLVAGLRGDMHSDYGFFFSPRVNARYALAENTVIRFAGGKGYRTASIFAENIGSFGSSRQFQILNTQAEIPYGLRPEESWNSGLNLTQTFYISGKEVVISLDGYHTRFKNQVVVDLENPRLVRFYNLDGESYSNSIQIQTDFSVFKALDIRLAYRFNDAKSSYSGVLLEKPLSSRHRAFINAAYATSNDWKFDATVSWQGKKRIPDTEMNPEIYRLEEYSRGYFLVNAHISKGWTEKFELYVGGENLLNFKQHNPIIAADDAFGEYFDSSLIWGPVMGMHLYAGLRLRLNR